MYKMEVIGTNGYYAKMICDSVSQEGKRICTLEIRYPRFILAELNTHRMISKNTSSSRAIPISKMIDSVSNKPAMPIKWGLNQAGMQAKGDGESKPAYIAAWAQGANLAVETAKNLQDLGLHKQISNRVMETYAFVTTVITSTTWDNFFNLRIHPAAQPEICYLAELIKDCMEKSKPDLISNHGWHLPYIDVSDFRDASGTGRLYDYELALKCSVARCARVSYLNHDKENPSIEEDVSLYSMLVERPCKVKGMEFTESDPVHASPAEHQAKPMIDIHTDGEYFDFAEGVTHIDRDGFYGSNNFKGWIQFRACLSQGIFK